MILPLLAPCYFFYGSTAHRSNDSTAETIMRNLLLGIDSGTQSTKVLVVDARDGKVLASATQEYDLIPNLPPGAKEQHPHTWREATGSAIRQALRQAKASGSY